MGFWIFMFIVNMLVPLTMIIFGRSFVKSPPKNFNGAFGYKTRKSTMNQATWDFAHGYIGNLWFKLGFLVLIISGIAMMFVINQETKVVGTLGYIVSMIQLVFLIAPIFPTEKALKHRFDDEGREL